MVCPAREHGRVAADVTAMPFRGPDPVPVAGCLAWDPPAAAALQAGELPGRGRRGLIASARTVAQALFGLWPELSADAGRQPATARTRRGWPGERAASELRSGQASARIDGAAMPAGCPAPAARSGIRVRSGEGYR
jgi:hypothetical protein